MSAAMTSFGFAFPTTGLGALPSAALPSDIGAMSNFGCPNSAFIDLEQKCSVTNVPQCAEAAATGGPDPFTGSVGAACCTSLSSFAESVASCYTKNAPSCLDTSALLASATADSDPSNSDAAVADPCAQYFTNSAGSPNVAATGSSPVATITKATGSMTTGGSGTTQATGSASSAAAAGNAAARGHGGVGLKVWIGVLGMGALGVLAL